MAGDLAVLAKSRQAVFASSALRANGAMGKDRPMARKRTSPGFRMPHLRTWRESLGLSRAAVVNKLVTMGLLPTAKDQATLAKWEGGFTAVKVEELEMLAKIYGVDAWQLFHSPGDKETPELLKQAQQIIASRDREAVRRWLAAGDGLKDAPKPPE